MNYSGGASDTRGPTRPYSYHCLSLTANTVIALRKLLDTKFVVVVVALVIVVVQGVYNSWKSTGI